MKVALVYDWIYTFGGAERVLLALRQIFPQAPLYTAVYDKNQSWAADFDIKPSFLQNIPLAIKHHEIFPFLTPVAFENFDFSAFDLVISVTSADAKGIITKPDTRHICYMLTPTRYLWSHQDFYLKDKWLRIASYPIVNYLKKWDRIAVCRPDKIIAISQTVKDRISQFYSLNTRVIYPPVDIAKFKNLDNKSAIGGYYLIVSRLVPYKRLDYVIKLFNRLNESLIIIGEGRSEQALKNCAGPNITFTGKVSEDMLHKYYREAKALIVPSEEDFGISMVEGQASGLPVIAYGKGGAKEIIVQGKTGILFDKQTDDSLNAALEKINRLNIDPSACRINAARFSLEKFKEQFLSLVNEFQTGW